MPTQLPMLGGRHLGVTLAKAVVLRIGPKYQSFKCSDIVSGVPLYQHKDISRASTRGSDAKHAYPYKYFTR